MISFDDITFQWETVDGKENRLVIVVRNHKYVMRDDKPSVEEFLKLQIESILNQIRRRGDDLCNDINFYYDDLYIKKAWVVMTKFSITEIPGIEIKELPLNVSVLNDMSTGYNTAIKEISTKKIEFDVAKLVKVIIKLQESGALCSPYNIANEIRKAGASVIKVSEQITWWQWRSRKTL